MCSLQTNLCGPNHVGDDWRRRRCGDAAATCTRNASCNRGVHDHGNARTQAILPHSLLTQFPADSGWRVMSSEQAVLPSPSNHFRRYVPPCSINLLSQYLGVQRTTTGRVRHDSGRGRDSDRKERTPSCLPAFLRFALCHHKIFRSFLVCLFWALHSDWEGDIAEIGVFRGDGLDHYEA